MSEKQVALDQQSIHHEVRNHLALIMPPLERLGSGSSAQVTAGYVEESDVDRSDCLTELGRSLLKQTERVAWDSAGYLYDLTLKKDMRPGVKTDLLDDLQGFLAVAACALKGVDAMDAPPGLTAPWVTWHLLRMAERLQARAEAEEVESTPARTRNSPPEGWLTVKLDPATLRVAKRLAAVVPEDDETRDSIAAVLGDLLDAAAEAEEVASV